MMNKLREHWILVIAVFIYSITVFIIALFSLRANQGQWVYPPDDTYIHMAIAKNVSNHQVWGITQYSFSSSTSSPLLDRLTCRLLHPRRGERITSPNSKFDF